jgi:hypothetical protein
MVRVVGVVVVVSPRPPAEIFISFFRVAAFAPKISEESGRERELLFAV